MAPELNLMNQAHPQSRQLAWQERKFALGLCTCCGREPLVPGTREGLSCIMRKRLEKRRRKGATPVWKSKKGGRPIKRRRERSN